MIKRGFMVSILLFIFSVTTYADVIRVTVSYVESINNNNDYMTYKLSKEDIDRISQYININSSKVNYRNGTTYKNIKGYEKELAWLIERDILSKDVSIKADTNKVSLSPIERTIFSSDRGNVSMSDFVMALSKAVYGVEESRPIIINSRRNKDSDISGDYLYDYREGEYLTYVTPNVYELYFRLLLDKGILKIGDFSNLVFIDEYSRYGVEGRFPSWSNELKNFETFKNNTGLFGSVLGQSLPIDGYKNNSYLTSFNTSFKEPSYFIREDVTVLEAMKLVESILRLTEKDMTNTEAELINYKYGIDYLNRLDSDSKSTVMFLVAKGIINFEDESEFKSIYDQLSIEMFTKLIYRVANKDGRLEFSKIQLTDEDNYWLSKGYYKRTIEFVSMPDPQVETTIKEYVPTANRDNKRIITMKSSSFKTYEVVRTFKSNVDFMYRDVPVGKLKVGEPKEVSKIEDITRPITKDSAKRITFKIEAPNETSALAILDSRTTIERLGSSVVKRVDSVITVVDGDKTYNYIPKSLIQESTSNEIGFLEDKYMINRKTGARAVILEKSKIAVIGNEIVDTGETMIKGEAGEVYYNMNIITKLMSAAFIDEVWQDKIFIEDSKDLNKYIENEAHIDIATSGAANNTPIDKRVVDSTYSIFLKGVRNNRSVAVDDYSEDSRKAKEMYSILHNTQSSNLVYKNIKDSLGVGHNVYMVVEWFYALPSSADLSNKDIETLNKIYGDGNNISVSAMSNFINKRPEDLTLASWWDSNIGFSDALLNYLYSTENVKYMSSGYLAPSVTILSEKEMNVSQQRGIFDGLVFSKAYRDSFLGGTGNPYDYLFGKGSGTYGRLAQTRKYDYLLGSPVVKDEKKAYEFVHYFADRKGNLYRRIDNLNRNTRLVSYQSKAYLEFQTVDSSAFISQPLQLGSYYKYNGVEYLVAREITINKVKYYQFVKREPIKGEVRLVDGYRYIYYTNHDNKSIDLASYIKSYLRGPVSDTSLVYNPYQTKYTRDIIDSIMKKDDGTRYFGYKGQDINSGNSNLNYLTEQHNPSNPVHGQVFEVKSGKLAANGGSGSILVPRENFPVTNVLCHPTIYVGKLGARIKEGTENEVEVSKPFSFLIRPNLLNIGINSSIIDSIVGNYYGVVTTKNLPDNAKVTVGNNVYTAKGGRLHSNVVKDKIAIGTLATMDFSSSSDVKTKINSAVMSLFDGTVVTRRDGKNISARALCDYVSTDSSGNASITLGIPPNDLEKDDIILGVLGRGFGIYGKGFKNKIMGTKYESFNGFVYTIQFNDSIKFRPTDSEATEYTLVTNTNSGIVNNLNIPFFTDQLSYVWSDGVFDARGNGKFSPAIYYEEIMNNIQELFRKAQQRDIRAISKLFIISLLMWLAVMNLMCEFLKRNTLTITILKRLSNPGGNIRGFDLFKFITFGMISVEDEPGLVRTIGVVGALSILLAVVNNWL